MLISLFFRLTDCDQGDHNRNFFVLTPSSCPKSKLMAIDLKMSALSLETERICISISPPEPNIMKVAIPQRDFQKSNRSRMKWRLSFSFEKERFFFRFFLSHQLTPRFTDQFSQRFQPNKNHQQVRRTDCRWFQVWCISLLVRQIWRQKRKQLRFLVVLRAELQKREIHHQSPRSGREFRYHQGTSISCQIFR